MQISLLDVSAVVKFPAGRPFPEFSNQCTHIRWDGRREGQGLSGFRMKKGQLPGVKHLTGNVPYPRGHLRDGGVLVYNADDVSENDLPDGVESIGVAMTTKAKEFPDPELRSGLAGPAALLALLGFSKDDLVALRDALVTQIGKEPETRAALVQMEKNGGSGELDPKVN